MLRTAKWLAVAVTLGYLVSVASGVAGAQAFMYNLKANYAKPCYFAAAFFCPLSNGRALTGGRRRETRRALIFTSNS
jgi:hypothetical protein